MDFLLRWEILRRNSASLKNEGALFSIRRMLMLQRWQPLGCCSGDNRLDVAAVSIASMLRCSGINPFHVALQRYRSLPCCVAAASAAFVFFNHFLLTSGLHCPTMFNRHFLLTRIYQKGFGGQQRLPVDMASHGTTAADADAAAGPQLLRWQRKDSAVFARNQDLFRSPDNAEHGRRWDSFNGPVARERLTKVWAMGDLNPFYLTVSRMIAMKFEEHSSYQNGMVLRRSCTDDDDVIVCRVHPEEGATILTIEVERKGGILEVMAFEMSGQELFQVQLALDTTWWNLSQLCFTRHKLVNVRFVKCDKVVGRMWWHENIDGYFPEVDAPHPGPVPKKPKVVAKKEKKPKLVAKKPAAQKEKKPKQVAKVAQKPALTDLIDQKVAKVAIPAMKKPAAK